jgi:plastocyanin
MGVEMQRSRSGRLVACALAVVMVLAACGGDDGGTGGASVTVTTGPGGGPAKVVVEAHDVYFDLGKITVPAGDVDITLEERGNQTHSFVFDGNEEFRLEVTSGRATSSGALTLEAGEYTFYCDIPGHRGQGMEGTLVAE